MLNWNLSASMKQTNGWQKVIAYTHYWQHFFTANNLKFSEAYNDLSHKWGITVIPLSLIKVFLKKLLKR
jgi:hypothetical protein